MIGYYVHLDIYVVYKGRAIQFIVPTIYKQVENELRQSACKWNLIKKFIEQWIDLYARCQENEHLWLVHLELNTLCSKSDRGVNYVYNAPKRNSPGCLEVVIAKVPFLRICPKLNTFCSKSKFLEVTLPPSNNFEFKRLLHLIEA